MSIYEDMLKPQSEEAFPCIYAKRIDRSLRPKRPAIHDKSFEGLKRVIRNGRVEFDVYQDFCLIIDGETGHCKVPDTPYNRKRLEELSTTRKGTDYIRKRNWDYHDERDPRAWEEHPVEVEVPPLYELLDKTIIQKSAEDALAETVMNKIQKEYDLVPKEKKKPGRPKKVNKVIPELDDTGLSELNKEDILDT